MEIEDILSTLIHKFESLKQVLGIFTPEELIYLFGLFGISLLVLTSVVICLERISPIILKILKLSVTGLISIILIMTVIMLGNSTIVLTFLLTYTILTTFFGQKLISFLFQ